VNHCSVLTVNHFTRFCLSDDTGLSHSLAEFKVNKTGNMRIIVIIIIIPPDIIIRHNGKGTCMLIDVAISGDGNVIKKKSVKILKYTDLTIEIQRMWNVKTKVIPVIIGATGAISKSFRKYASNITRNHEVKELQKTAILGTAHILRKVLM